jgi:hypothetical protein
MDSDEQEYLWAVPQIQAMFEATSVIFMGYSGAIPRISTCMEGIAQWAAAAGVRHFAVDSIEWASFAQRAERFVAAAGIGPERYWATGATTFMRQLSNRVFRSLTLELVRSDVQPQALELAALTTLPAEIRELPDDVINEVGSTSGCERFTSVLIRRFSGYAPMRDHRVQIARALAWIARLSAEGWRSIQGLPILERGHERLYLAAAGVGVAATNVAVHIRQSARMRPEFASLLTPSDAVTSVSCLLLMAPGDVSTDVLNDLVYAADSSDIVYGEGASPRYFTERAFLEHDAA